VYESDSLSCCFMKCLTDTERLGKPRGPHQFTLSKLYDFNPVTYSDILSFLSLAPCSLWSKVSCFVKMLCCTWPAIWFGRKSHPGYGRLESWASWLPVGVDPLSKTCSSHARRAPLAASSSSQARPAQLRFPSTPVGHGKVPIVFSTRWETRS
jgi:hypothetical protein